MPRKTVDVEDILVLGNHYLEHSPSTPDETDKRLGVASFMEVLLVRSGQYKGFRYLDAKFEHGKLVSGDESRRAYFL